MTQTTSHPATRGVAMNPEHAQTSQTDEEMSAETLVEEVSIDGMCGVY
ncbi:hypothetical protein NOCARDAX2BIS_90055 [Nocardioides sp. AX2bis]|nr:hypothetical protein NOCARDAX2BIS_90055 [Nocardioides sp. AX2bis]